MTNDHLFRHDDGIIVFETKVKAFFTLLTERTYRRVNIKIWPRRKKPAKRSFWSFLFEEEYVYNI